jgi:hypothetical protein
MAVAPSQTISTLPHEFPAVAAAYVRKNGGQACGDMLVQQKDGTYRLQYRHKPSPLFRIFDPSYYWWNDVVPSDQCYIINTLKLVNAFMLSVKAKQRELQGHLHQQTKVYNERMQLISERQAEERKLEQAANIASIAVGRAAPKFGKMASFMLPSVDEIDTDALDDAPPCKRTRSHTNDRLQVEEKKLKDVEAVIGPPPPAKINFADAMAAPDGDSKPANLGYGWSLLKNGTAVLGTAVTAAVALS